MSLIHHDDEYEITTYTLAQTRLVTWILLVLEQEEEHGIERQVAERHRLRIGLLGRKGGKGLFDFGRQQSSEEVVAPQASHEARNLVDAVGQRQVELHKVLVVADDLQSHVLEQLVVDCLDVEVDLSPMTR